MDVIVAVVTSLTMFVTADVVVIGGCVGFCCDLGSCCLINASNLDVSAGDVVTCGDGGFCCDLGSACCLINDEANFDALWASIYFSPSRPNTINETMKENPSNVCMTIDSQDRVFVFLLLPLEDSAGDRIRMVLTADGNRLMLRVAIDDIYLEVAFGVSVILSKECGLPQVMLNNPRADATLVIYDSSYSKAATSMMHTP